jgi:hypothetical protein
MRALFAAALILLAVVATPSASAHGMRSAYVQITETDAGRAEVLVRTSVPGAHVEARFAAPCRSTDGEAASGVAVVDCKGELVGKSVSIDGLGPLVTEAVVWVAFRDGTTASHLLTRDAPRWELPGTARPMEVARQYVRLGIHHILTGGDHLLFLLALVLCLRRPRAVLAAETAFTFSHSLSFSAATLGWVHVSPRAAEACIALSLVMMAADIRTRGEASSSSMHGALLALVFGLVHGLGFAGGLSEIGVPDRGIPVALASFAVGVEIGQVAFLALVLGVVLVVARTRALPRLSLAGAYVVGGVGAFWLIERLVVCFAPSG